MTTKIPAELSSTPGIADSSNATAITIDSSENCTFAGTINDLGFQGPTTNFVNSMLISQDAGTGTLSTASSNTGFGYNVFNVLTSGRFNVGMGQEALKSLTSGDYNIGIGSDSLAQLTEGDRNTSVGAANLDANTTGSQNVAVGYGALSSNTTASANVAIGDSALEGATTGGTNVAIGEDSLKVGTTLNNNTAVGKGSGILVSTGASNTLIGLSAGATIQTGSNNICIGNSADCAHDDVYAITLGIGFSGQGNHFKFGRSGNVVSNQFTSDANWSRSSDERIKQDINDDKLGLNFINNLRTVTYRWKPSYEIPKQFDDFNEENQKDTEVVMHGMLAQEVKQALDNEGVNTFSGWSQNADGMQNISREMFVIPLIKAVQQLSEKCDSLQNEINELKGN